jgi:hypothetical protein
MLQVRCPETSHLADSRLRPNVEISGIFLSLQFAQGAKHLHFLQGQAYELEGKIDGWAGEPGHALLPRLYARQPWARSSHAIYAVRTIQLS